MKANVTRFMRSGYLYVFIAVMMLDVISKQWVASQQINLTLIPGFFHLIYTRNTGAAWSILANNQALLAVISFVAGVGFSYYYLKNYHTFSIWNHVAAVLFIAGTWGNFIDRAFFIEGVIDFIALQFWTYRFPTFNVADSALTIGVVIFIATSLFEKGHD